MLEANILQLGTEGVTVRDSEFRLRPSFFLRAKIQFIEIDKESRGRFTPPFVLMAPE